MSAVKRVFQEGENGVVVSHALGYILEKSLLSTSLCNHNVDIKSMQVVLHTKHCLVSSESTENLNMFWSLVGNN